MLPKGFIPRRSVHVTFDNSDGKQQTLSGHHTTLHTTGTIFQNGRKDEEIYGWESSTAEDFAC